MDADGIGCVGAIALSWRTEPRRAFTSVLSALATRKVLVHCQINLRASSMVFLHRAITAKEDPRVAYDAVARVWSPDGAWKTLMRTLLRKNGVNFDPY